MLTKEKAIALVQDESIGFVDKAVFLQDILKAYPPIIGIPEVCEILGCSRPTATRFVADAFESRVFPVAKTKEGRGGRYRIPTEPFLRYAFLGEVHPLGIKKLLSTRSKKFLKEEKE